MGSINRIEQLQTLGERVRLARAKARLSQKGMADLLGISRKTYILVEQGKRDLFTFDLRIIEERTGIEETPHPKAGGFSIQRLTSDFTTAPDDFPSGGTRAAV